ncbi:MAG: hypothetical protein FJX76_28180, partial [Armatimonadetes bacterium]|nr:hypothetical protein [Armatimonadota bacterium]
MSLTVNLSETCSEAQVDLFLALFRGHPDRMARRLEGTRYELHDHALDAAAARAHLNGLNHAALIPRLPDGTTRVLAIGLHNRKGRTWKSDALLLARAAAARGIPLYLERTRSALGVHAWVFFRDAISVEAAHQLAELLLRDAASEDGWVKSFERIVPAADGEGPELVSLPLCGAAVREGNGVFIEAARGMPAVRDQWALLASLRRMDRVSVHRVLAGEPVPVAAPAPDQDPPTALGAMRAASLVLRRPLSRRLAA